MYAVPDHGSRHLSVRHRAWSSTGTIREPGRLFRVGPTWAYVGEERCVVPARRPAGRCAKRARPSVRKPLSGCPAPRSSHIFARLTNACVPTETCSGAVTNTISQERVRLPKAAPEVALQRRSEAAPRDGAACRPGAHDGGPAPRGCFPPATPTWVGSQPGPVPPAASPGSPSADTRRQGPCASARATPATSRARGPPRAAR